MLRTTIVRVDAGFSIRGSMCRFPATPVSATAAGTTSTRFPESLKNGAATLYQTGVNPKDKGFISNPTDSRVVQQFLSQHSLNKTRIETNPTEKQRTAKTYGNVLVTTIDLTHN